MTEKELGDLVLENYPFVFRCDNGKGFVGGRQYIAKNDGPVLVRKGQLVLIGPAPIKYGLVPGSGDWIGWETVEITLIWSGRKLPDLFLLRQKQKGIPCQKNKKHGGITSGTPEDVPRFGKKRTGG